MGACFRWFWMGPIDKPGSCPNDSTCLPINSTKTRPRWPYTFPRSNKVCERDFLTEWCWFSVSDFWPLVLNGLCWIQCSNCLYPGYWLNYKYCHMACVPVLWFTVNKPSLFLWNKTYTHVRTYMHMIIWSAQDRRWSSLSQLVNVML